MFQNTKEREEQHKKYYSSLPTLSRNPLLSSYTVFGAINFDFSAKFSMVFNKILHYLLFICSVNMYVRVGDEGRERMNNPWRVMAETFMLKKKKKWPYWHSLEAVMSKSDCIIITGSNKNRFLDSRYWIRTLRWYTEISIF